MSGERLTLPLVTLTAGGVRWQFRPDWLLESQSSLFGPAGLRLAHWLVEGHAVVVKSGPHRTVYRVVLPCGDFHLKHYHARKLPWLRCWLPSPARRELERTEAVADRAVPTLEPLALGECGRGGVGGSYLVTRTWAGGCSLADYLEVELPALAPAQQTQVRQLLAEELGRFLARLHRAGVIHRDLHPGNLLLRWTPDQQADLVLIDLHTASLCGPLEWPACRANLVILNRWFMLRANRTDRLRFWHSYQEERERGEGPPHQPDAPARESAYKPDAPARGHFTNPKVVARRARDLEKRTLVSNLRFWWQHDLRSRGNNRYFRRLRSGDVVGHAVADLSEEALAPLLADPDAPFQRPDITVLKDSPTSSVVEFDLAGKRVIYKRFAVSSWTAPLAALVRLTPALRSFVLGHGLRLRCLPTPRPLAVWHRRRRGLPGEGYLLTEKVPEAIDLAGHLDQLHLLPPPLERARLREVIDQVARLIRVLHARHLSHRDLKAANLLVSTASWAVSAKGTRELVAGGEGGDPGCVWFIDLVGVRRHLKLRRRRRIQNLTRLHASFHSHPALTRTDKLRFLRVYLTWGLRGKGGWKRWWRQIEEATLAKVQRNLRNGRPLG